MKSLKVDKKRLFQPTYFFSLIRSLLLFEILILIQNSILFSFRSLYLEEEGENYLLAAFQKQKLSTQNIKNSQLKTFIK